MSDSVYQDVTSKQNEFQSLMQKAQPDAFTQALSSYPVLSKLNIGHIYSPNQNTANMLEFWSPGEEGDKSSPRPKELQLDQPGVQVFSGKTRPIDILGDVVSHYMVNTDPKIGKYRDDFEKSLNDDQKARLKEQYDWSVKNEGEERPFSEWYKTSGLPAYFRGYAFKQWPDDFNEKGYTKEQKAMFDDMMKYLSGGK